ncbi:MAG TPA: hypothetical protein VHZ03_12285 [Trebonia sp.]|nr:hypothetical protein [Trebonia sp.]
MLLLKRFPVVAFAAGLAALTGCQVIPTGGSTAAPAGSSTEQSAETVAQSTGCKQAGTYLTAIRTGQQASLDRVVFQFSGALPKYNVTVVKAVYADPKGVRVPLAGQAALRVVFHGATAWCPPTATKTYTGPSVLTPFYPRLLDVSAAGDFEQVLSFGIGLAAQGPYRVYTLTGPNRVVLDVGHVALAKFPGIWDITSWHGYWESQYSWATGHQPWLSHPAMVVQAWARSRWGTAPAVRQVNANTFTVTAPGGRVYTVTGTRPVPVPGPWVITKIR